MNWRSSVHDMIVSSTWKLTMSLIIFGVLAAGCAAGPTNATGGVGVTATLATEARSGSPFPPSTNPPATAPPAETSTRTVTNVPMGFCFAYPEGYTQPTNAGQVEIVGPYSGSGPEPGLMWVVAADAQGRTAQDVADGEVKAVGGLNPPRSTVVLGGEGALVLDGMPGQDAVRKAYIVHEGKLYTLTFSPYRSENTTANAQMETLYSSVTSSWVWMSSGKPCPGGN